MLQFSVNDSGAGIGVALASVRKHLAMEVAYVSEFSDTRTTFREVDAPGLESLIKVGDSYDLDDVYCRHILAGRLPELMADTADYPLARSMPITRATPIGAHLSVPVRLPDGKPYGMFCCLSPQPNRSLNDRDLQVMRVFADMAGHQMSQRIEAERSANEARARIEAVIAEGAFRFLYQPIMTFEPFRTVGFEALCRFTPEPYRTPDKWFNEAAWVGAGVRLELAAIERALSAFALLPDDIFISLNVSPETILSGGLEGVLRHVPARRVVLEVTEHAKVDDYAALGAALGALRAKGARLAIDDAGAGFSSLQHIIQLQPDIIKLDMGLTRAIDTDPARRALASALAFFARETKSEIVAEGIETEAESAVLRDLGVTKGQGYLLGRPMDIEQARARLASPMMRATVQNATQMLAARQSVPWL